VSAAQIAGVLDHEPVLDDDGIDVDLSVGVGIDCGAIVVTRVGWMTAQELTAYGSAVNHACKLSDQVNQVSISRKVMGLYPSGPGGKMQFDNAGSYYRASAPLNMLPRNEIW
jgi:class 3 adenylate cyclase